MRILTAKKNGVEIALVQSEGIILKDVQSALDLMATVRYETGCVHMVIHKSSVVEEFFDLKTRLAGEILQKFINYHMKIAIVGDFSVYSSQSLQDFIYECNKGRDVFFVLTEEEALKRLSQV